MVIAGASDSERFNRWQALALDIDIFLGWTTPKKSSLCGEIAGVNLFSDLTDHFFRIRMEINESCFVEYKLASKESSITASTEEDAAHIYMLLILAMSGSRDGDYIV